MAKSNHTGEQNITLVDYVISSFTSIAPLRYLFICIVDIDVWAWYHEKRKIRLNITI